MLRRLAILLVLVVAVPLAGATAAPARSKVKLKRFSGCGQLVRYAKRHRKRYEPGGPPPQFAPRPMFNPANNGAAGAPAPAAAPSAGAGEAGGFSLTNNQEAGVFEPDIVKFDGEHTVYALTSDGTLQVVDVSGAPTRVGSLGLGRGYGHQMLLVKGDKALVTWSDYDQAQTTTLAQVDLADPAKPVLEKTLTVDGNLLAERRTRSTVRVVLRISPAGIAGREQSRRGGRGRLSRAKTWLPTATFANVPGGTKQRNRRLVGCRSVRRPRSFSGLEQLTVLTIDFDKGLDPVDADTVMTGGDTVYASADNLFVATQQYQPGLEGRFSGPVPQSRRTQIHRFSLDDADNTTYRGSGTVPGFVLNQFSLSEQGDVLRVATTDVPPWFTDSPEQSHSLVTALSETADGLDQLGQVGGLGKGERIYAVRFLGDAGYVVTFRQTDPLYVVDLSDPAAPKVRGELKIDGFSSYLHPISGDRLIGVGTGPATDGSGSGLQLSEFDVSDLDHPSLQQRTTLVGGSSEVAYDHHAFLWWAPRDLAVLPVTQYTYAPCDPGPCQAPPAPGPAQRSAPPPGDSFSGAIGFTVRPEAISEAGRISHGGYTTVRRSLIVGDTLYTMSDAGLGAARLDDFSDTGFAAFPGQEQSPPPEPAATPGTTPQPSG